MPFTPTHLQEGSSSPVALMAHRSRWTSAVCVCVCATLVTRPSAPGVSWDQGDKGSFLGIEQGPYACDVALYNRDFTFSLGWHSKRVEIPRVVVGETWTKL